MPRPETCSAGRTRPRNQRAPPISRRPATPPRPGPAREPRRPSPSAPAPQASRPLTRFPGPAPSRSALHQHLSRAHIIHGICKKILGLGLENVTSTIFTWLILQGTSLNLQRRNDGVETCRCSPRPHPGPRPQAHLHIPPAPWGRPGAVREAPRAPRRARTSGPSEGSARAATGPAGG